MATVSFEITLDLGDLGEREVLVFIDASPTTMPTIDKVYLTGARCLSSCCKKDFAQLIDIGHMLTSAARTYLAEYADMNIMDFTDTSDELYDQHRDSK